MSETPSPGQDRAVHVRAGGVSAALAAGDILQVLRRPGTIRVPHGPPELVGLANLGGMACPVYSLAALLGQAEGGGAWAVLLRREPALGLLVDTVEAAGGTAAPGMLTVREEAGQTMLPLADFGAGAAQSPHAPAAAAPVAPVAGTAEETAAAGFLAFTLGGQNYAMPLSDIIGLASVSDASSGSAMIRDRETELVPLAALLGMAGGPAWRPRAILVEAGGRRMGLVVGEAREILRAEERWIGPPPAWLNKDDDAARIHAVIRRPDGRGIVSVLTVASLFGGAEHVARDAADLPAEDIPAKDIPAARSRRFMVFTVGREHYACPVEAVGEVAPVPRTMAPVPGAPDDLLGIVALRGRPVAVLDQRRRFGAEAAATGRGGRLMVIDAGGVRAGFLVDGIAGIRDVPCRRLGPVPALPGAARNLFGQVILAGRDEPLILVIDPERLLSRAETDRLQQAGGAAGATAPQ